MSDFIPEDFNHIAEHFVDVSDVFTDEVDGDGLQMLLSSFLEISHLSSGEVFIVEHVGMDQLIVSYSASSGVWERRRLTEPTHLASRSLHTLQTEFTIAGQDSQIVMHYAFPLRVRGTAIGAVELQDSMTAPLNPSVVQALQNLADLAASVIDRTHSLNQTRSLVGQLQTALNSRVILEQAKGILAERLNVDFPVAFKYLRNQARKEQLPLHQVAQKIVSEISNGRQPMKVAN